MNTKFSDLSSKVVAKEMSHAINFSGYISVSYFAAEETNFRCFHRHPLQERRPSAGFTVQYRFSKKDRVPFPKNEKSVKSQETAPGETEKIVVFVCRALSWARLIHVFSFVFFFFTYTIQTFPCPKHFPPIPCALPQKYFPSQKDFRSPFFVSLLFFGIKHFLSSMFCSQKWTTFGHLPARLKHLNWKTSWRPSARFRWVNINLNCPLFLEGGRFQNWTPGNSRGEELPWSSFGWRKEKANWGREDPISRIKRNGEQDVPERRQSLHHGALVQRDQHRHSDHWSCLGTRLRLPAAFSVCLQVAEIREKN